jgi:hypothetical protein
LPNVKLKKRLHSSVSAHSPSLAALSSTLEIGKQLQDLRHLALSCYQQQQDRDHQQLQSQRLHEERREVVCSSAHIELLVQERHPSSSSPLPPSTPQSAERKSFEQLRERLSHCEAAIQQQRHSFSSPSSISLVTPPE